jgi:hypothetical protein
MKRRKTEWIWKLRDFRTKLSDRTVAALFLKPKLSNVKEYLNFIVLLNFILVRKNGFILNLFFHFFTLYGFVAINEMCQPNSFSISFNACLSTRPY